MKLLKFSLLVVALGIGNFSNAQLYINGATFYIEAGATVTVQGDITSTNDITGAGKVLLKGSSLQNVNMNGFTIPNLELDNVSNATLLTGNTKIGSTFLLTNGRFLTGAQDLILSPTATITGQGTTRFVWTNGAGQLKKELTGDVANFTLPVGENTNYRPAFLTTTGTTTGTFGVKVISGASPNKPPMIASYINTYWPITKTGMNGTVSLKGQYVDPSDITGTEANLAGYFYDNTNWSSASETHDEVLNQVGAPIATNTGVLYGMNKFVAVGASAFLQEIYISGTGLLTDAYRTPSLVIPTSDPYRTAEYIGAFPHVANPTTEVAAASVFNNQVSTNDDIADWVFLQLRNTNASPGNTVLQTRSALIKRNGNIVDIDGISPVTFNVTNGTYAISVRHRNHLGLSVNPTDGTAPRTLSETQSIAFTTNAVDLRTITGTKLFGTAAGRTTSTHPILGTVNLLWGGNVNGDGTSKYIGPGNDRLALLSDLGNVEGTILTVTSVNYRRGDLNYDKSVKYIGPGNDRLYLLSTILSSVEGTIRTQELPN
ncbi:MAG: hypothetical protein ABIW38_12515 [Ferruginibacter sp.]